MARTFTRRGCPCPIDPLRIGAFGYAGKETGDVGTTRIRVYGPDATISLGMNAEFNLQALRRWDEDPFLGACTPLDPCPGGLIEPRESTVDMGHAELVFLPNGPGGRWALTGLVNYIDADDPVVSLHLGEQDRTPGYLRRYRTGAVGANYLLRRNVRLTTEAWWDFDADQARFIAGVMTAF